MSTIDFTAGAIVAGLRHVAIEVGTPPPDSFTETFVMNMVRERVLPPPDSTRAGLPRWTLGQLRDIFCGVMPVVPGDADQGLRRAKLVMAAVYKAAIHDERREGGRHA